MFDREEELVHFYHSTLENLGFRDNFGMNCYEYNFNNSIFIVVFIEDDDTIKVCREVRGKSSEWLYKGKPDNLTELSILLETILEREGK